MKLIIRLLTILCLFFAATQPLCAAEGEGTSISAPLPILTNTQNKWSEAYLPTMQGWKILNRENRTMIVKQSQDSSVTHEGEASEKIRMIFAKQADIFLGRPIDFPWVIEELAPSLWIRSNRPGMTLGAQIVLPRTLDPKTGRPFTFLVRGSKYTNIGEWQNLHFLGENGHSSLYHATQHSAKVLCSEVGLNLDRRGMYVRQLVLYIDGQPGLDNRPSEHDLWIGRTQLQGEIPVWSTMRSGLEKLEPEFAQFQQDLRKLREAEELQKAADDEVEPWEFSLTESETAKKDESDHEFHENTSSRLRIPHRIEVVGSSSLSRITARTVQERQLVGFTPKFDPLDTSVRNFLIESVTVPVFPNHVVEFESGSHKWEHTIDVGRDFGHYPSADDLAKSFDAIHHDKIGFLPSTAVEPYGDFAPTPSQANPSYVAIDQKQPLPFTHRALIDGDGNVLNSGGGFSWDDLDETSGASPRSSAVSIRLGGQTLRRKNFENNTESSFSVRAIEYRGEPLEMLYYMGFNTVWLSTPPTQGILEEANNLGIWLICPPPPTLGTDNGAPISSLSSTYDRTDPTPSLYRCVLAWNLGDRLVKWEIDSVDKRAQKIRASDRNAGHERPFICSVESGAYDYSRIRDMIILGRREPLLTTLDFSNYSTWLRDYKNVALRGTTRWATVQTQPDAKMVSQWDLFGGHREQPIIVTYEQIRLLVREAIASGSHGILYTSQSSLMEDNPETRYRVAALALMNCELAMIEEWFAEGQVVDFIESSRPQLSWVVLSIKGARLLLPLWNEPNSQYAFGRAEGGRVSFIVRGIPETFDVKLMTPGGFERVQSERVAGGRKIYLEDASMNSIVLLTESGDLRGRLEERARMDLGKIMANLAMKLAKMQLESDEKVMLQLRQAQETDSIPVTRFDNQPLVRVPEQQTLVKRTRQEIEVCENFYNRGDYTLSYLQAERATRGLRRHQREIWIEATRSEVNRSVTPVSTCFANVPSYITLYASLQPPFAKMGPNLLPCGDFECPLETWIGTGWKYEVHPVETYKKEKDLQTEAWLNKDRTRNPGAENNCLQLSVRPSDPERLEPVQLETPPMWVTTPPIRVDSGQLICVSGWINIPQTLTGSVDGFMIRDSIGEDPLALRFRRTDGWQEFTFFRYAPSDGLFETQFLLSGIGEVYLDDVSVCPVVFGERPEFPPSVPGDPKTQDPSRWGWDRLNPLQYFPNPTRPQK